jgi:hypothetical protein
MRLRTVLGTTAATLLLLGAGVGSAQAGEVNGKGRATQGPTHANSICVFSGLADGGEGEPAGPGEPPQNWGQIPKEVRDQLATQGEHPGDACNGHTGFLAGGGEEP